MLLLEPPVGVGSLESPATAPGRMESVRLLRASLAIRGVSTL